MESLHPVAKSDETRHNRKNNAAGALKYVCMWKYIQASPRPPHPNPQNTAGHLPQLPVCSTDDEG